MTIIGNSAPLHRDAYQMVKRWRRAGYDVADMPHVLLTSAMCCMAEVSYNRDVMLIGLDNMKAHIDSAKDRVAVDWHEIEQAKARIGSGARIPNFDEHVKLFP